MRFGVFRSKKVAILASFTCMFVVAAVIVTHGLLSKAGGFATNSYVGSLPANALYVEPDSGNDTEIDVISTWRDNSGAYYMFLPSNADENNLTIWSTYSDTLYIDNDVVDSGQSYPLTQGTHKIKAGNTSYNLNVMKSANIPSIYITLDNNKTVDYLNESKENKASGTISFVESDGTGQEVALSQIKGRGNSSWDAGKEFGKYPYNIKLDSKTDVFGMGKMKKWCLLANVLDESMVRNRTVNDIANAVGLDYSTTGVNVDLYVNGEYIGDYVICEKVEVGSSSLIGITDLEKATEKVNDAELDTYSQVDPYGDSYVVGDDDRDGYPNKYIINAGEYKYIDIPNNPADITGGYLLEFDYPNRQAEEMSGFVTDRYQAVTVKSPEYASKDQVIYIKDYLQRVEDAVYASNGTNAKGEHYSQLIDVESFAKVYLINEFTKNLDTGESSYYMYKDANGLLCAGPVWDYDWALGSFREKEGFNLTNGDGWYAQTKKIDNAKEYGKDYYNLCAQLCTHSDFMDVVKQVWNESFKDAAKGVLSGSVEGVTSLNDYYNMLSASAAMNYKVYDTLGWDPLWYSADTGNSFKSNFEYLTKYISSRISFMSALDQEVETPVINTDMIYFDNSETKWDTVYCYYWSTSNNGSAPAWPGEKMTSLGENVYSFKLPSGCDKVIFTNNKVQTSDLPATKGYVFVPDSFMSNYYTGNWANTSDYSVITNNDDNNDDNDDNDDDENVVTDRTVYFDNTISNWSTVNCYYWPSGNNGPVSWPGEKMSTVKDSVYSFNIPEGNDCVIFNDGGSNKTNDLTASFGKAYTSTTASGTISGEWKDYSDNGDSNDDDNKNDDDEKNDDDDNKADIKISSRTVCFDNTKTNWSKVTCYYWSSGNNGPVSWPGKDMSVLTDNVYSYDIPEGYDCVIFTNGGNSKTADLKSSFGKVFVPSTTSGNITGTWNDYGYVVGDSGESGNDNGDELIKVSSTAVYYDNANTNWSNVYCYYWSSGNGGPVSWPGTVMTNVKGSVYKFELPAGYDCVIFTNGRGSQTSDLKAQLGQTFVSVNSSGSISGFWSTIDYE